MDAFVKRSKAAFGMGELCTWVRSVNAQSIYERPVYDGITKLMYESETHMVELATLEDVGALADFLNVKTVDAVAAEVAGFCEVVASSFLDYTAKVIANAFLRDMQHDPGLRRSGFDVNKLYNPSELNGCYEFYVKYRADGQLNMALVQLNTNSYTMTYGKVATWPDRKFRRVGPDGEDLGVS